MPLPEFAWVIDDPADPDDQQTCRSVPGYVCAVECLTDDPLGPCWYAGVYRPTTTRPTHRCRPSWKKIEPDPFARRPFFGVLPMREVCKPQQNKATKIFSGIVPNSG